MSYIEDDISNYHEDDIEDDEIIRDGNRVKLKGKLIIDDLVFRIDLSRDEINLLNSIK